MFNEDVLMIIISLISMMSSFKLYLDLLYSILYEEVLISHNTKVGIVYVLSIILIISAFMWTMNLCYNTILFLPLFVTILFTLIVIIVTCLALCELEL
jgi:hypothetical protein|nr:MAG TPA: hypothetical protein [Caudoviricetes sp.]